MKADFEEAARKIAQECTCMRVRQASRTLSRIYDDNLRRVGAAPDLQSVVEMGGASTASDDNRVTEASVRGFWKAYRAHMGA